MTPEIKDLSAIGETEEAELITINGVTVKSVNAHQEYTVEDKYGKTFMIKVKSGLEVGKTYHVITGVVTYSYGNYKLLPVDIVEKEIVKEVPKTLSGIAFLDQNHNGKYDRPDKLLKNIKVSIYKENELVEEVITDENGEYKALLLNDHYTIRFEQPNGLIETFNDKGNDEVDSDIINGEVKVEINELDKEYISAGFTKPVGKMKRK